MRITADLNSFEKEQWAAMRKFAAKLPHCKADPGEITFTDKWADAPEYRYSISRDGGELNSHASSLTAPHIKKLLRYAIAINPGCSAELDGAALTAADVGPIACAWKRTVIDVHDTLIVGFTGTKPDFQAVTEFRRHARGEWSSKLIINHIQHGAAGSLLTTREAKQFGAYITGYMLSNGGYEPDPDALASKLYQIRFAAISKRKDASKRAVALAIGEFEVRRYDEFIPAIPFGKIFVTRDVNGLGYSINAENGRAVIVYSTLKKAIAAAKVFNKAYPGENINVNNAIAAVKLMDSSVPGCQVAGYVSKEDFYELVRDMEQEV